VKRPSPQSRARPIGRAAHTPQPSLQNTVAAKLRTAFSKREPQAPAADLGLGIAILDAYRTPLNRSQAQLRPPIAQPASRPQQPARASSLPRGCYAYLVPEGTQPTRLDLECIAAAFESKRDAKKSETARKALEQYEWLKREYEEGRWTPVNDG
jgi:hypothetical protein